MNKEIKITLLSAVGVMAVSLGGCAVKHPNAMPTGYKYHSEVYKSPTPQPSPKVTVEQRKYMDVEQAEQFRDAVYDLLIRITERAGMPPKPVYVAAPDPMTVFYANIDNDLRESMRSVGYVLSDTPDGAYVFTYEALLLNVDEVKKTLLPNIVEPEVPLSGGEPNVVVTLRIFDSMGVGARMLTQESGEYYIKGAERLHIVPSQYRLFPSEEQIQMQAQGISAPAAQPMAPAQSSGGESVMDLPMGDALVQPTPSNPTSVEELPMGDAPSEPTRVEDLPMINASSGTPEPVPAPQQSMPLSAQVPLSETTPDPSSSRFIDATGREIDTNPEGDQAKW